MATDTSATQLASELVESIYAPTWSAAALRVSNDERRIAKMLVVGNNADTKSLIQQLAAATGFEETQFEQASAAASGFEYVLLIAPIASEDLEAGVTQGAQAAFELVKSMLPLIKRARFVHLVPSPGLRVRPEYQGLSGFYKSLRIEKPSYVGRVVHYDPVELHSEALARVVLDEFQESSITTDVRYRDGTRYIRQFHRPAHRSATPAFKGGGVYLITGGMGAIGRIVARHLCANYGATVYLTGRSLLTDKNLSELTTIAAAGGKAHYLTCDVTNQDEVRALIAKVRVDGHRLHGVLHAAGVIEDSFLLKKTADSFARVIAPKALGAWHLDQQTREEPLDFFVLFSSVTGVLGNVGQSDYGFANSFEDYFAHARDALVSERLRSGQTLSINWPFWKEGGMTLSTKQEDALRRNFGIVPLGTEHALAALEYGLAQRLTQMVVMPGDAAKVAEVLEVVATSSEPVENAADVAPSVSSEILLDADHDLVAIVGLSGRYPQAETLDAFWENLSLGRDCIVEVPRDRWDVSSHFRPGRPVLGKTYGKWGGFLEQVDQFDPLFFSISPKEAEHMDPHERLFLETVALTLEDAGYTPDTIATADGVRENPVGVFVGVMWGDYQLHAVDSGVGTSATPHSFYWAIANRVSYVFNFSGPSIAVDTACSSSLTAIHMACAAIQRGEVTAAIAGGVNLAVHPHKYNLVSDMHFLSTEGKCRSFGEGGDGYVPGEGVGAVLLKSLSRARSDGDHIYALVRGSSLNHGGKTSGFTVPNPNRQAALIQEALRNAEVDPRHVSYVEAHGTGTSLGDPIELTGLSKAFAPSEHQQCPIGSVKANIGHLEAAAGIAGLTKVLLQMKHRTLLPSIHSSKLNPYIDWKHSPFYVQRELEPWHRPKIGDTEIPRLAGISSFGAGGSNAHLIVQEYVEEAPACAARGPVLIVLSAKKAAALKAAANKLADHLEANLELRLADVAYTLQLGRVAMDLRIAFVAEQTDEVIERLRAYARTDDATPVLSGFFSGTRGEWQGGANDEINSWIDNRDLLRLGAAWVGGCVVDWTALHEPGSRRRVSLPGYTFQRQRYWIDKPPVTKARASGALHPLLDANVSTLEAQTFSKVFAAEEFFLRDHKLGDNRIVPAVVHLEMAIQASVLASVGRRVVALRDITFSKPVIVNDGPVMVQVRLIPERDAVRFQITSQQNEARVLYSQGFVELAAPSEDDQARPSNERVDIDAVIGRSRLVSGADIAATFANMGFHFGPTFQVFESLHSNLHEALATLRLPKSGDTDAKSYILHPAVADGALRTVLGIGDFTASAVGVQVPVNLQRLDLVRPVTSECFAYARRSRELGHGNQSCYDILLLNRSGEVLARFERLTTQLAPQLALSAETSKESATPRSVLAKTAAATAAAQRLPTSTQESATKAALKSAVTTYLAGLISDVTKLPPHEIDPGAPLENYGIDSVMILTLNESLERTFGEISKTLFFEYLQLDALADYFVENHADRVRGLAGAGAAQAPVEPTPSNGETPSATAVDPRIEELLFTAFKSELGAEAKHCSRDTPLVQWPLDPINQCKLLFRLRHSLDGLSPRSPYVFKTLRELAGSLRWQEQSAAATPDISTANVETSARRFIDDDGAREPQVQDIAIIGLSGRYPGADDVDAFWNNLSAGRDSITEIPASRWSFDTEFTADRSAKGRVYSKWGGFIQHADRFDSRFFNISAREADVMDPQERLFLQTAWECLEDSNYTRTSLKDQAVGVFVGVMWGHYELIDVSDAQLQYGRPSASFSSIANRVSYFLNLAGPSMALDTMCSSSLTAIHIACQSIRSGDCQLAIAGGANLHTHPHKYRLLCHSQFLSSDGRCRAFGEGGDGYVPGEGVGAVLLKPLDRALADGDHIYAVIKGSSLNHGGKTNGFTVPNQVAQTNVIGTALRRANWHSSSIDYIEAHGTGTSLGDPIEIASLSKAFARHGTSRPAQSCRIGSAKSNIGHLESAAGIAGLTKVLMQFKHRRIAPSLHSATLNRNINFGSSPFRVVQHLEDWDLPVQRGGARRGRRAGISSFGAGGSNAHLLVEESLRVTAVPNSVAQKPVLFVLSADSDDRLGLYVDRMIEFLDGPIDLANLAYSSQVGREAMDERLAVVAASVAELADALTRYRKGIATNNLWRGSARRHSERLDTILDEQQQTALIESMLREGRLTQIARAWVSFLEIDFSRFIRQLFESTPARVPFPKTPFIAQRHWVQEKCEQNLLSQQARLHPLLDQNVSTLSEQRYVKSFTGDEFYLRDHIVAAGGERRILPGVASLEMVRAAGELAQEQGWTVRHIRNFVWMRPIEVSDAPFPAQVSLSATDDAIEVEISDSVAEEVYVQGQLSYAPKDEVIEDEWVDIEALRAQGVAEEDPTAIYAEFRKLGFLYGRSYQVTQARYRSAAGTLSRLRLPDHLRNELGAFVLHPSLMDAAARTCLAVREQRSMGPLVPFALGELEIRHPLPEECYAYATLAEDSSSAVGALQKYNVVIADATGRVLVKLLDFAARSLVKEDVTVRPPLRYFHYEWLETPLAVAPVPGHAQPTVLVIAKHPELSQQLTVHPRSRVVWARPAGRDVACTQDEAGWQFDACSDAGYRQLIEALSERGQLPDHVVYCLDQSDASGVHSIRSLFLALEAVSPGHATRCLVLHGEAARAQQAHDESISALGKSLLTLNHRFELFTVQWDAVTNVSAIAIARELEGEGNPTGHEIAYRDNRRYRRRLLPDNARPSTPAGESGLLRDRGAYLITGGAGKLGLVFARHLAKAYRARLILSGRSRLPSESQQTAIAELRRAGAEVHYFSADVAREQDAAELVRFAKASYGELDGVIHCAGIVSAKPLTELSREEFTNLLAPKITGLEQLDRLTATEPLAFFVAFSSVASILGDPGSGAYAVGNRFMDAYMMSRETLRGRGARQGRSVSINWPLWSAGGMGLSDEASSLFQLSGMTPLTEDEGIAAFENILRGERTQVLVAAGDEERIARTLQVPRPERTIFDTPLPHRPIETSVHTSADTVQRRAEQWVMERVAVVVKATASSLNAQRSFEQLGMDSVMMMELLDSLGKDFGALPKTVLFEYETPARLVQYLLAKHAAVASERFGVLSRDSRAVAAPSPVPRRTQSLTSTQPPTNRAKKQFRVAASPSVEEEGVAIIGIAGQFPNAADLSEFWDIVRNARECLSDIPSDRWGSRGGRVTSARGGFLADVDRFDPALFRMSLAEAEKSDPQLRVLLRAAWQAIEDAAYTPDSLASSRVGVYMGAMNEDFTWIMSDAYSRSGEYAGPGSMASELANRVSFLMNFRGPSLTVATACASSLTAVHLARRAILDGECDVALAGAVNLSLHPSKYLMLDDMKVLSPNGEERTFDDAANGFVPSEGAGVVMLKRLSRALQDGDQIYGVIRGSCVSHSGTGAGQYLPNIHVLEETVARCLRDSGIRPEHLTYIESHGTGTALGDPIELKGLANGLRQFTQATTFCAIGTRANLGHMESASGLCALIKVLLSMKHRELAPCAKLDVVNTSFEHESSPFYFPRTAQAWSPAAGRSMIAGVNSFGMGGSNAFMIVESFARAAVSQPAAPEEPSIVVLSAQSDEQVRAYLAKLIEFLERPEQQRMTLEDFANLAYSSQIGRMAFEHRLAIVAEDRSAWLTKARAYLESGRATHDVLSGNRRSANALATMLTGAEGQAFVAALIKSRQWLKIAAIWAGGGEIDWASLHIGRGRRRVSFPNYPFKSVRCDIRGVLGTKLAATVATTVERAESITLPQLAADSSTARVFETEWFHLAAGLLGEQVLPGDFHQIETWEEWARQYWLDHLTDSSDTHRSLAPLLALDSAEPGDDELAVGCVGDILTGGLIASLQRCTQKHRIEVETLIVAAWAILMNRYTKARCSQFGVLRSLTPVEQLKNLLPEGNAGSPADLSQQLRNLIPVRIRTVTRDKIAQWIEKLQDDLNHTHVYGHIPLQRIEGWLGADDLFDSVVVFEKTGQPRANTSHALSQTSQRLLASEIFASQTRVAMELTVRIHTDAIDLDVLYRSGGLARSKIETLLEHFKVLLEGLATHPERTIAALPMRTRTESREALWKTLERVNQ